MSESAGVAAHLHFRSDRFTRALRASTKPGATTSVGVPKGGGVRVRTPLDSQ